MEEQILKIIMKHITRTRFGRLICKSLMAEEITSHVMEFDTWKDKKLTLSTMSFNGESYEYAGKLYEYEKLYQYWLTNIKTKRYGRANFEND